MGNRRLSDLLRDIDPPQEMRAVPQQKTYKIGERIVCDFPLSDGTSKNRPVIVWGKYFDKNNCLVGFDILPITTNLKQTIGGFIASPDVYQGSSRNSRTGRIKTSCFSILPLSHFDLKRDHLEHLKQIYLPDLLARRAVEIVFDPNMKNYCTLNFNQAVRRIGFTFPATTPDMIKAGIHTADVPNHPDMTHIRQEFPDSTGLTQDDVNLIATWAILRRQYFRDNELPIHQLWPEIGAWPHWEPVSDGNGHMIPCCSPERKAELMDVPITPVVEQKLLAEFGHFKI